MPTYVLSKIKRTVATQKAGDIVDQALPTATLTDSTVAGADEMLVSDVSATGDPLKKLTLTNLIKWAGSVISVPWTRVSATPTTFPPDLTVADEGSDLTGKASKLNFVGNGVAATGNSGTKTITITSGSGPQGPTGPAGADGQDGQDGATGPRGPAGANGSDGATGPRGLKGDKGDKGDTGSRGPTGATGAKGEKGDTGATGTFNTANIISTINGASGVINPGKVGTGGSSSGSSKFLREDGTFAVPFSAIDDNSRFFRSTAINRPSAYIAVMLHGTKRKIRVRLTTSNTGAVDVRVVRVDSGSGEVTGTGDARILNVNSAARQRSFDQTSSAFTAGLYVVVVTVSSSIQVSTLRAEAVA